MGREQTGCFVVPPKFKRHCLSFEVSLVRGESRGRFRPRSAAVLRQIPAESALSKALLSVRRKMGTAAASAR